MAERIDAYEAIPRAMKQYLSYYGRHFSKPLYEMAVEMMETRDGGKVKPMEKQAVLDKLEIYSTRVETTKGMMSPMSGPWEWRIIWGRPSRMNRI